MVSTWNTAQSGNWNVAANWTGGIPNATDATANFTTLGATVSPWVIDLGGATYTVGTLNVAASVIEHYDFDNGTLAMKISSTARGASAFINVSSANNSSFNALDNTLTLSLLSRTTIDNLTAGKFDVAAKITGASALVATGSGTVLIDNASNNWTGGLVITGGTVQTQGANVLAGGALDVNTAGAILDLDGHSQTVANLTGAGTIENFAADATLTINETTDTTFSGTFEDGHAGYVSSVKLNLTKTGAATLTLAGGNNYTQGVVTISQGTIALGAAYALAISGTVSVASGASLDLAGFDTQINTVSGAGSIVNSGSSAHYLQLTGASTFAGSISGAINVQLDDSYTSLALSGSNSYTGTTILQGGSTLKAGASGAFSVASAYYLDGASSIDLNGYNETISSLAGPGTITNNGSSSSVSILTFANNGVTIFLGELADGTGKLGLDLTGSGTMVLAGANTNSATTTIEAGSTLAAGAENALSASSLIDIKANGKLDLIGYDQVVGGLTDLGTVFSSVAGDVTLTVGPSPLGFSAFSGSITDGAGVVGLSVATGASFHLNGAASTYSGATNISAGSHLDGDQYGALSPNSIVNISSTGVLALSYDQTIAGLTGAGTVVFNEVQNTTLTVDDALSSTFSGQFSPGAPGPSSDLVKTGAGTLTLSGNNSKAGDMTVEGGTLAAGSANAFSAIGELAIVSNGTADLAGYNETVGSLGGFSNTGVLTNSGAMAATLTVSGGGYFAGSIKDGTSAIGLSLGATSVLTFGGANTYSGLTKIGAGAKLSANAANVFSAQSAVTIAIAGTLDIKGYNQTIGTISGTGSITNTGAAAATLTETNAATASFTGTLSDGSKALTFAKAGAGQLKLSGTNTYSGGTIIQGGTLEFASAAAAGSGAIDFAGGVTLQLDSATPLTNTIEDFAVGDKIDFAGIAFAAGDHFVLQSTAGGVQTWALETAANSVVTTLKLAGHYGAGDFTIAAQANGTAVGLAHNPKPISRDFNADLKSDILMTDPTTGLLLVWEMDGTTRLASSGKTSSAPGANYTIIGTGDFNGDGKADILMQDQSTGHTTIWEMNGTTRLAGSGQAGSNQGAAYKALGAADFNGDGKADILWENTTTGQVSVWLMNGTTKLSGANVSTPLTADWSFAGTGDFDGDGKADIVFQNATTGAVKIWLMDGTTMIGGGSLAGTSGAGHEIVGIGDFDGDGKSDLLWETTSSTALSIWFMDGMTRTSHDSIGDAVAGHQVVSVADYNGDGMADILLQTTSSGHLNAWLMDGSTKLPASGSVSSNPGTTWHIVAG